MGESKGLNSGFENKAAIHSSVVEDIFHKDSHCSECAVGQIQESDTISHF